MAIDDMFDRDEEETDWAQELRRFQELRQPSITPPEAPGLATAAPMPEPMAQPTSEPMDELQAAQERRRDMLRNIGLIQAASQIGGAIASGQAGPIKTGAPGLDLLKQMAETEYEDVLTRKKEKGEKEAADLYRDLLKQQIPNLEISEDVPASHLKGLLGNFRKASRAHQQSQYMTKEGDPISFNPSTNQYVNTLTGQPVQSGEVIRNYVKTVTDPKTGEIKEVRPGVGVVKTIAGAPEKRPREIGEADTKDYTYDMLNPKQRNYLKKTEDAYIKDINDSREFGELLANIDAMIDSDISAAIPAIKRQLARSVGKEVGVMTDKDVAAFSGDQSLAGAVNRFAKLQATGKMTDEDKQQFKEIMAIARRKLDQAIENRAGYHISKLKQRLPDATPTSLRSLLSVEASKPVGVEQDPKIQEYADKYKLDYDKARSILMKRGYKPQGQ